MALTNYPNGISSFGIPTFGTGTIPPFSGNYWFVDETNGLDGNSGTSWDKAVQTLSRAQVLATAENDDVVFFRGTIHQTAALAWAKNKVHLVGVCAPLKRGKRARISVSGSTAFSPLINVTAQGCYFLNFGTFFGFSTDALSTSYCISDTGGRNCYDNVEILGFGGTGTGGNTGARAMLISGSTGENTFRSCVFGVDTIARSVANYTLEFTGGSPRNHFIDCEFEMEASAATPAHLYTAASGAIDRSAIFERCIFGNAVGSTATTINQVASIAASAGGLFVMKQSVWYGATHLETSTTNQFLLDNNVVTTTDPGLLKNNA